MSGATFRDHDGARRKVEYPFDRVTVTPPEPVRDDTKRVSKAWIGFALLVGVVIVSLTVGLRHAAPRTVEPSPAEPAQIFGMMTEPECWESYPPPPPMSFLARTIQALEDAGAQPHEIRDFMARTYIESNYNHEAVSPNGKDHGLTQINQPAHPDVDVDRLKRDPAYVVETWLPYYRELRRKCGDDWQCCYRRGVVGCRKAVGK